MLHFSQKTPGKNPGNIIIIPLCTKNLDDMICSSWNVEYDGLKWVILGQLKKSKKPKKSKLKKMKIINRDIIILYMWTITIMMYSYWDNKWDWQNFLSFWANYWPFTPLTTWKIKILKWKKHQERSLYTCIPKK